jgi:serine/threonine protein kinase/Flp pilus assembly protein TadD
MTRSPTVTQADSEADSLVARLAGEMHRRWHQGERPLAEEFLNRHPDLWDRPEEAVELIYEEICLRQELDGKVRSDEIVARFPGWRMQLRTLLDCHHVLDPGATAPLFPAAGDWLGESRLLGELGRGAQGRVFLATQPALADRAVVLKMVPLASEEHLSLARLQHTHIVPVYSVQDDPDRRLRALCLPYFGGVTLDRILAALDSQPPGRRTGRRIVEVLAQAQAASPVPLPVEGPACRFFRDASYPDALCWVGARLADALQYAHERGLLHLDLKASNVLLAADGQPMLLDFHLAQAPLPAGGPPPLWLGGTPGYMAPEHQAALLAVRAGQPLAAGVDARADIYSLGVLLFEALGGPRPRPAERPGAALRRHNPQVTPGLAAVLARCLAPRPEERYPDAGSLAADLRRHLEHQPLRGVANRSWAERWRKWRRRSPHALALQSVLLAFLIAAVLLIPVCLGRIAEARQALASGNAELQKGEYAVALREFKRGADLIEIVPFTQELRSTLRDQQRQAEQGQTAEYLHQFVEGVRTLCGGDDLPRDQGQAVAMRCRDFWRERQQINQRLGLGAMPQQRQQVQADMLDLAILWTQLRVSLAGPNEARARRQALEVLDQAEELFGSSQALCLERLAHAKKLGLPDLARQAQKQADSLPPHTAREHFALGRALYQAGRLKEAGEQFDQSLELQENNLWAHFYRGKCQYQLENYTDALASFQSCVVLARDQAWCYYNRGLAQLKVRQTAAARKSLIRALELDPQHRDARAQLDRLPRPD